MSLYSNKIRFIIFFKDINTTGVKNISDSILVRS